MTARAYVPEPATIPRSNNWAISVSVMPATLLSISSVCSPSKGARFAELALLCPNVTGEDGTGYSPSPGKSIIWNIGLSSPKSGSCSSASSKDRNKDQVRPILSNCGAISDTLRAANHGSRIAVMRSLKYQFQ